jgi:hypothetical protein
VSASAAPHGFRANALGLLVPEEVSRERHVMSWQEWRDLEKVTKSLEARGIVLQMKCSDPAASARRLCVTARSKAASVSGASTAI